MKEDDQFGTYHRTRPTPPAEGWRWLETGPHGPTWYPPVVRAAVDPRSEHLELSVVTEDRQPGTPLARAGAGPDDILVVELLDESPETMEAVERLFDVSFEELGTPAAFDLAYDHASSTANLEYANPAWCYRAEK